MKSVKVACVDVYYYEGYANAACIVFEKHEEEKVIGKDREIIRDISEYIPGQFYKRELPCILAVLEKIEGKIDFIITDSFVWLNEGKRGLGAHLHEALNCTIPVIGVAKTFYEGSTNYVEVYRGSSTKPLYVSAVGLDLKYASQFIKELEGEYRMPDVLKLVDQLSREHS